MQVKCQAVFDHQHLFHDDHANGIVRIRNDGRLGGGHSIGFGGNLNAFYSDKS